MTVRDWRDPEGQSLIADMQISSTGAAWSCAILCFFINCCWSHFFLFSDLNYITALLAQTSADIKKPQTAGQIMLPTVHFVGIKALYCPKLNEAGSAFMWNHSRSLIWSLNSIKYHPRPFFCCNISDIYSSSSNKMALLSVSATIKRVISLLLCLFSSANRVGFACFLIPISFPDDLRCPLAASHIRILQRSR